MSDETKKKWNVHWDLGSIETVLDDLKYKFESQQKENDRLKEENRKLKEGIWRDEEMSRLKSEHEKMKRDYYRGFPISEEEQEKINNFIEDHTPRDENGRVIHKTAIGGSFTYHFVPTSIGTAGTIEAINGDKLTFQEIG